MCYGSFDAASMRIMAARYARPSTPARAPETPGIRARTVAKASASADTRAVKIVTPLGTLTFYQRPTPVRAIEQDNQRLAQIRADYVRERMLLTA